MIMTKVTEQYTLHIVMIRRSVAIDSIEVSRDIEISIAILDHRLSLWGVVTHTNSAIISIWTG
jgi:hypothetical protein